MELLTKELEDRAAARLNLYGLSVSDNPSENLLAAISAGLLLGELATAEAERKHVDQSIKAGRQLMELVGAVA